MEQVFSELVATIGGMSPVAQVVVIVGIVVALILLVLTLMRIFAPVGMGLGMGLQGIGGGLKDIGEGLGKGLASVGEGVKNVGQSFVVGASLFQEIGKMFSNAGEGVKATLSGVGNMFTSFGKAAENATTHTLDATIEIPGQIKVEIEAQGIPAIEMAPNVGAAVRIVAENSGTATSQITGPNQPAQLPPGRRGRGRIPLLGGGNRP